jgi:predicted DNA-binding transcriptional regulator AlpA
MTPKCCNEDLLDTPQAAEYLGYAPKTLERLRYYRRGPAYIRLSQTCVRYRRNDLDAWLAQRGKRPHGGANHMILMSVVQTFFVEEIAAAEADTHSELAFALKNSLKKLEFLVRESPSCKAPVEARCHGTSQC